jgi:arabinogalactan oligomer/maltooligosaccharide transport system permease protein
LQQQFKLEKKELQSFGRYSSAFLSAVFMGVGQLFNGQWLKGIFLILLNTFVIIPNLPVLLQNFKGLITLGEIPMEDHSLFMMIYGIISVILALLILFIYIANIRDAYKNGLIKDKGGKTKGFKGALRDMMDSGFPYLILLPGFICIIFFTLLPMVFNILIAFTNYDLYHSPPKHILKYVGLKNFFDVLTTTTWARTFKNVLIWTIIWSVLATLTTYALGGFVAVLLNNPRIKFRKIIRTLLILPYAIPSFISILIWKGMLNTHFGVINKILTSVFSIQNIPWFENAHYTKVAIVLVNLWLGFPYSMMLITGILQGLPNDVYEAATVDGANGLQKFRYITLPLVLFAIAPLLIMSFAYNFNNFNIIYLLNNGNPPIFGYQGGAGGTDILISWVYKLTFEKLKFNYAAAMSLIIFILIVGFSVYNFTRTKSYKEEEMLR